MSSYKAPPNKDHSSKHEEKNGRNALGSFNRIPPLIRPLPTKTTPLSMKKRMEEMQQVSCTVVPLL
jgi:hypothetical protein